MVAARNEQRFLSRSGFVAPRLFSAQRFFVA
jgi:hypothetical protein